MLTNLHKKGTKYEIIYKISDESFNWTVSKEIENKKEDWNIAWKDTYINEDDLRRMLPYQKINHFPGSIQLGRKNFLSKNLMMMKKTYPEDYDFYPQTWLLPYHYEDLRTYAEKCKKSIKTQKKGRKPVFIIKPEASCQGKGIYISKKIDGVILPQTHYVV